MNIIPRDTECRHIHALALAGGGGSATVGSISDTAALDQRPVQANAGLVFNLDVRVGEDRYQRNSSHVPTERTVLNSFDPFDEMFTLFVRPINERWFQVVKCSQILIMRSSCIRRRLLEIPLGSLGCLHTGVYSRSSK
jgi:hypothetical protein